MKDKNNIEIGVKATGFEEAAEQMELMADAMNEFPATVNIKAKECEISIHTTNYIEMSESEPSWAKGGVRPESDLDEEWSPEEEEIVLPKGTIKEMCMLDFLKETKKRVKNALTAGAVFRKMRKETARSHSARRTGRYKSTHSTVRI